MTVLLALCHEASADQVPHAPIEIKDDGSFTSQNGVTGGNGTAGNPYIIEGWSITNTSGIHIRGTTVHFVIRDVALQIPRTDINMAIWLYKVSNGDIENVTVTGYLSGIVIDDCSRVTVSDTVLEGTGSVGLEARLCKGARFSNVTVSGTSHGISLSMCEDCLLEGCTSTDNAQSGIEIGWRGSGGGIKITLDGCVARRNPTGIYLAYGSDNVVRGCVAEDNTEYDLYIESAPTTIDGNSLGKAGLEMMGLPYLQNVSGTNTVGGAPLVFLVNRSNVRVGGPAGQVFMWGCDNVTLEGLSFDGVRAPITVYKSTGTHVVDCTVSGAYVGLYLLFPGDANVTGCTFDGTSGAFGHLVHAFVRDHTATFRDCSFSNGGRAIIAYSDRPLTVVDTTFGRLDEGINVTTVGDMGGTLTIDGSNFTDCDCGLLAYKWDVRINRTTIEGTGTIGAITSWCRGPSVRDSLFRDNPVGLVADNCTVSIMGCTFLGPGGVAANITESSGSIWDCTFEGCSIGLRADSLDPNFVISDCVFEDVDDAGIHGTGGLGLCADSRFVRCGIGARLSVGDYSYLSRCLFDGCGVGLLLESCIYAYVVECDFERSLGYAIDLDDETSRCTIYHNILRSNNLDPGSGKYSLPQARDASMGNTWHTEKEGNYWEDMPVRYPDAKPLGRVWDTPYGLDGGAGASDWYPLTLLVDLVPPVAVPGPNMVVDYNATFELNGSASTDDLGIASFEWSFFDGARDVRLEGAVVQLAIARLGTFAITLTVKDAWGNAGRGTVNVTVVDREPPVAAAGWDVSVEPGMPAVLNATASRDNVGIAGFAWTIDPGGLDRRLLGPVVAVTLPAMGDYRAVLNVTDTSGNWATDEVVIHVTDLTPPVAVAGPDVVVDQGAPVAFDGSLSNDNVGIAGWTWIFDYGGMVVTLGGSRTDFTFDIPGVYVVVLTVRDEAGNAGTASMTVTVRDTQPPMVDAGQDVVVDPGTEVTLSGAASSDNGRISDYLWTVPRDATTYEVHGIEAKVSFPMAGTYHIRLKVTDAAGNWATDTVIVHVRDISPPSAEAGADITVDEGANVALDGSGSLDDVGIVNYTWTFEEGSSPVTLAGPTVSHAFAPGSYTVTLRVEDAAGNTATDTVKVTVLPREVVWALGPFLDKDGKHVPDVTVTVRINDTSYTGTTNATGWFVVTVKRHDLVSPARVTASKKGYRTATFTTQLDKDGRPLDAIPRLERDQRRQGITPGASTAATVTAIGAMACLCLLAGKRRTRPGR